MRIIDWSSDVCSSDLHKRPLRRRRHDLAALEKLGEMSADERARLARLDEDLLKNPADAAAEQRLFAVNVRQLLATRDRLAPDRKKVVWERVVQDVEFSGVAATLKKQKSHNNIY